MNRPNCWNTAALRIYFLVNSNLPTTPFGPVVAIEKIRELYGAQPFQPFVIHMADGREIEVCHADFVATAPSGRTTTVYQPDDSLNLINLLLVTDLEVRMKSNNSRRRRGRR